MAKVEDKVRDLQKAQLIPEREYDFEVRRVRVTDSGHEYADLGFVSPPDKEIAGRRVSYWLGNSATLDWRGLTDLLMSAQLTELPLDENGEKDTETSLPGVAFSGRLAHVETKRGPDVRVYPNIDYDWAQANMGDDAPSAAGSRRAARKKKGGGGRRKRS